MLGGTAWQPLQPVGGGGGVGAVPQRSRPWQELEQVAVDGFQPEDEARFFTPLLCFDASTVVEE